MVNYVKCDINNSHGYIPGLYHHTLNYIISLTAAMKKLHADILNIPYHIFGHHTNCSPDFCKTKQSSTKDSTDHSHLHKENIQSQLPAPSDGDTFDDIIAENAQIWEELLDDDLLEESQNIPYSTNPVDKDLISDL